MTKNNNPPWLSIAILSMTALAYEILLMRMFSIIQWHHFAYMIISLALLGYGASGTFLALFRKPLLKRYTTAYISNIFLFALSTLLCFLASQHIGFNAEEILWDPYQSLLLATSYILLAMPFFFAANAIGLTLIRYQQDMSRIYAADLVGAGFGSIVIISLLFMAHPGDTLKLISALGVVTAFIASWELRKLRSKLMTVWIPMIIIGILLPFILPQSWTDLEISPYKGLSQTLRITGTKIVKQDSSPLGMISVVKSPVIPFRHAPGLSLNASVEPPAQVGVFIDADSMTAITQFSNDKQSLAYLDQLTSALPYHLDSINNVLILGAGGGSDVLQARFHGVNHITAVELNEQIIDLLQKDYREFSGGIFDHESIEVHAAEARGFITDNNNSYDLIQLALLDSFSASSAGLYALNESYIYTVESLQEYMAHVKPDGFLAISRWIKLPPRDTLKMFATAIDALHHIGIKDPENRLVLIRSLQTSTLLIKNGPFSIQEIASIRKFCDERSFDTSYYPGMPAEDANRFNVLEKPYFYTAAISMLDETRQDFMERYKFNLEPATDDRPYFFQFFKWKSLPEILTLTEQGGMPLLEWGYLILVITLVQAILASIFLIILPLFFYRKSRSSNPLLQAHSFIYFFLLGLAFLFIEIAFIQKFILFLHHPIIAVAVVLAAFLIFAGLGSAWSKRFTQNGDCHKGVKWSVTGILLTGIVYLVILGPIFSTMMTLSIGIKIILSIILIAPLAFCMGMPFPLGLSRLGEINPGLVPWVWGVNGCASVLSAILATLLAIHFGFSIVIIIALTFYAITGISSYIWIRNNTGR